MKRWFKRDAESEYGAGIAYLESSDGWPSRQVEIYGGVWLWGDSDHPRHLGDQPIEVFDFKAEHEISADEFEQVWREAQKRCPPSS